jgi:hypothetical protein
MPSPVRRHIAAVHGGHPQPSEATVRLCCSALGLAAHGEVRVPHAPSRSDLPPPVTSNR